MSVCQAAVLTAYREPLRLLEYPVPEVGPGESLVRIEMAGICGTDVHLCDGELSIPLPVILGHETVGRVERLGEGLRQDWRGAPLVPGDRVTWASSVVCGQCYYCRLKRQPTRCVSRKAYGITYTAAEAPHLCGGYAQYILLRAGSSIFRIPEALPTDSVIGAGCALTTALHSCRSRAHAARNTALGSVSPPGLRIASRFLRHGMPSRTYAEAWQARPSSCHDARGVGT
jgi:D-arabinose 1-dehydrogenase-like Zn-dependent alcohol dehydrogenase